MGKTKSRVLVRSKIQEAASSSLCLGGRRNHVRVQGHHRLLDVGVRPTSDVLTVVDG